MVAGIFIFLLLWRVWDWYSFIFLGDNSWFKELELDLWRCINRDYTRKISTSKVWTNFLSLYACARSRDLDLEEIHCGLSHSLSQIKRNMMEVSPVHTRYFPTLEMVTPLGKDPLILPYIYEIPLLVSIFGRAFSFIFFLSYFLGCHASLTPHICLVGDIFILKLTLFTPTTWDTKWSSHSLLGYSRATKPFGHPLLYLLGVTKPYRCLFDHFFNFHIQMS